MAAESTKDETEPQPNEVVINGMIENDIEALWRDISSQFVTEVRVHPHLIQAAVEKIKNLEQLVIKLAGRM